MNPVVFSFLLQDLCKHHCTSWCFGGLDLNPLPFSKILTLLSPTTTKQVENIVDKPNNDYDVVIQGEDLRKEEDS